MYMYMYMHMYMYMCTCHVAHYSSVLRVAGGGGA